MKHQEIKVDFNRYVPTWLKLTNSGDGRELCMFTGPRNGQAMLFDCPLTIENLLSKEMMQVFASTGYFTSFIDYFDWVCCSHFLGSTMTIDGDQLIKIENITRSELFLTASKAVKFTKTKFNFIWFDEYKNQAVDLDTFNF